MKLECRIGPIVPVISIASGLIDTETSENTSEEGWRSLCAATPLRLAGKLEETAEMAYFLLSARPGFVTGQPVVAAVSGVRARDIKSSMRMF